MASGETALYSAIYEGLRLFKKCESKDHSKWIVAITDGADNSSTISLEKLKEYL